MNLVFLRPVWFALAASIAVGTASLPALAQQIPVQTAATVAAPTLVVAKDSSKTGSSDENGSHRAKVKKRAPLVEANLRVEKTYAIGADQLTPPGVVNDNQILLGGDLFIRLAPKLRFVASRSNHFDVGGRTFKSGKPVYGGAGWDLEYRFGLAYAFTKDLNVVEAYDYRYRVCCPNAADRTNTKPRTKQGLFTGISYRVGPNTRIGKPLQLRLEGTYIDHHVDLGFGLPAGTPVLGNAWVYKVAAYLSVPVFGQTQVVPFIGGEHFIDYFDSQLVPSMTNRSEYGVRIKGSSFMSYRAYVKNDHQTNPNGDVPHKVTLYLETTFKLHS